MWRLWIVPGREQSKFFEEKAYTVLWVQGNHENYDMIGKFLLKEWNGGRVRHIVRDRMMTVHEMV